jgi:hypothetical protein
VLLDDPGRVRSQITSVVYQIQRFDFDCNLVVTRKVIIRIPPGLGLNPLYRWCARGAQYRLHALAADNFFSFFFLMFWTRLDCS